jgi:hypothetical protein
MDDEDERDALHDQHRGESNAPLMHIVTTPTPFPGLHSFRSRYRLLSGKCNR